LRRKDGERPRLYRNNQPPGIKEMMADMGMKAAYIGKPLSPSSVNTTTPGKTLSLIFTFLVHLPVTDLY
jgi:mitogen-activated protein kinase kinase kinase